MQKGFAIHIILIAILFLIVGGVGGYLLATNKLNTPPSVENVQKQCTLEARVCSDGSSVGRTGPNCQFAECPVVSDKDTQGWAIYANPQFSIMYPSIFVLQDEISVFNRITLYQIQEEPGAPLGHHISVYFVAKSYDPGVDPYNSYIVNRIKKLTLAQIGETIITQFEDDPARSINWHYKRVEDKVISGKIFKVFINNKPFEIVNESVEEIVLLHSGQYTNFEVSALLKGDSSDEEGLDPELFNSIVSTLKLK